MLYVSWTRNSSLSHVRLSVFVLPEDVRLTAEEEEEAMEDEVEWDLLGCCLRDLMAACVPLLPLL